MSRLFRVDGDAYDDFMGRYSTRLAPLFADFAGVSSGALVLDVGAGTGALTAELMSRGASVAAADPSPEFDLARAQLVVGFVSDAPAAVAEMARVARRLAVCMWGIAEVDMFRAIDETAEAIGATRGGEPRRYRTPHQINELLAPHGEVESAELDVTAGYQDSEECWQAMGPGVGPAGQWVASLDPEQRQRAYEELSRQLGSP